MQIPSINHLIFYSYKQTINFYTGLQKNLKIRLLIIFKLEGEFHSKPLKFQLNRYSLIHPVAVCFMLT